MNQHVAELQQRRRRMANSGAEISNIPRLGQLNAAQHLPVSMSWFVARYRALFDDEIHIPKRLDLSEFGDLADYLHFLVLGASREVWTFQRFAPFAAARIGLDLTGAEVTDQRFAPYNRRLDEKLAASSRESPVLRWHRTWMKSEANASPTVC